jgi:hypothetical protein
VSTVNPGIRLCICCHREIKPRTREAGEPRMVTICLAVYRPMKVGGATKGTPGVRICDECLRLACGGMSQQAAEKLYEAINGRLSTVYRSLLEADQA